MLATAEEYKARFHLYLRCENCMRESMKAVDVPNVDDAPCDPEDLIDSAFLQSIPYSCRHCYGSIGKLFKIDLV